MGLQEILKKTADLPTCFVGRAQVVEDGSMLACFRGVRPPTDEEFETFMIQFKLVCKLVQKENFAFNLLLEVCPSGNITFDQALRVSSYLRKKRTLVRNHLKGTIVMIHSPLVKMIVDAVMNVIPNVKPFETLMIEQHEHEGRDDFGLNPRLKKYVMDKYNTFPWPEECTDD